jgi:protein SCO1
MSTGNSTLTRRSILQIAAASAAVLNLSGCSQAEWYGVDVEGTLPDLSFEVVRARDGAVVTEADYRGRVAALFLGYTYCPDICPTTLAALTGVAHRLGPEADRLSVLFVTADPARDTLKVMSDYTSAFTGRADGLRPDANRLAALARRYRITYRIEPHEPGDADYTVSHGQSIYVFDPTGKARLIWPKLGLSEHDIAAAAGDVSRLLAET